MAQKTENRIKKSGLGAAASRRISNAIVYIALIAITLIWLFPFFGLVMEAWGFPDGLMVKNYPSNAGDTGLIPDPGRSHVSWSN